MKRFKIFRQTAIIIAAAIVCASCGDFPTANQSANVPANQNAAPNAQKNSTPAASPVALAETSPGATPPLDVANSDSADTYSSNANVSSADSPVVNSSAANANIPNVLAANGEQNVVVAVNKLIIPVEGIKREQLQDTFKASRSEGRVHDAIDIMASQGTPVIAAADGEIAKFFESVRGGITIYQFSRDKKLIYYYAHLQRRADGLQEGQFVRQGTVVGYVGDTGNSGAGNFHLHFSIWTVDNPKSYWNGTNINPYPLLRQ